MKIFLNELELNIQDGMTAFALRDSYRSDADIVILNGFAISQDMKINEGDRLTLIKRGQIPQKDELEHLMAARHTPGVHSRVKKASVGIAGLGGLGSNIAISLARLGVGKLLLVDFDMVEPSNLNRQQYYIKHIGMAKVDALKEILSEINPFIEVTTQKLYLDKTNIPQVFQDVDIVVEAFDNPKCKAELVSTVLSQMKDKKMVAASGMAGYGSSNLVVTRKVRENFYLAGDGVSEAKPGSGLMAPRVAIAANHQANMVLRLILGESEV